MTLAFARQARRDLAVQRAILVPNRVPTLLRVVNLTRDTIALLITG